MKLVQSLILLVGGVVVGLLVGRQWGRSSKTYESEAAIGREVALLQRAASTPSCADLRSAPQGVRETRLQGARVFWRSVADKRRVQRLVISDDLDFAYEEVDSPCPP